jgi:hypothetical protein
MSTRPRQRLTTLTLLTLTATATTGCYREVVSAKGLGAAAYQSEVGKGGNYSGLSFDDATREEGPRYTAPSSGIAPKPR